MRRNIFPIVTLLLLFTMAQPASAVDDVDEGGVLLHKLLKYVYENQLDTPELDSLVQGAVDGMLSSLNDPYTEYFTNDNLNEFKDSLDGNFVGIGINLGLKEQLPYVVDVIPDSPALNAEIRPGDVIVEVDGKSLKGLSLSEIVDMIRGPEGSTVILTIQRNDTQTTFRINRGVVNVPTVAYEMFGEKTGYININSFGRNTTEEFSEAMDELTAIGMQALILDLRNNSGGYLNDAVDIASYFIDPGKPVVSVVDREGRQNVYRAGGVAEVCSIPMAVLVNSYSASSSEVLAAALQDYGVCVLVGEQTYGKGVVQSIIPIEESGALKLTIAKYLTPLNRDINLVGLKPDISVLTPSIQLLAARRIVNPPVARVTEFTVDKQEVLINGEQILNSKMPFVDNDQVFVPLRFALESMSFEVGWEEDFNKASRIKITGYGDILYVQTGEKHANLNGQNIVLSTPILLRDGTAFISIKDLEVLNIKTFLDSVKVKLKN